LLLPREPGTARRRRHDTPIQLCKDPGRGVVGDDAQSQDQWPLTVTGQAPANPAAKSPRHSDEDWNLLENTGKSDVPVTISLSDRTYASAIPSAPGR
jgi:hypothetical protein